MKTAKEIYEALEKVDKKLGEIRRTFLNTSININAVSDLMEAKDEVSSTYKKESIDYAVLTLLKIVSEQNDDLDGLITAAGKFSEEGLSEPEAEKGHWPTEEELRDIYREKHTNVVLVEPEGGENHQAILDKIYFAVRETRAGEDVTNLKIEKPGVATIYFATGARKDVNIECDSGIAMIMDVCKALM